jgi:hypothetical protein
MSDKIYKTSERERQIANDYYKNNKEKCLKQRKDYYNKNKEKILLKMKLEYDVIGKGNYDKNRYIKNKEKLKLKSKKYYHNNKLKIKNYLLNKKYGLSLNEYIEKWKGQKGKCEICNKEFSESNIFSKPHNLVVDHNHYTKQIRGLLCNSCNRALGLFQDKNNIVQKAYEYLTKWESIYDSKKRY